MKIQRTILATLALVSACIVNFSAFGQGALTPPGAPAPTMKSLDQIEARTIVNAVNTPGDAGDMFIISQPGSYYLTTNLTATGSQNGITITTNNVTLDLNGFALQGGSGSSAGTAINITGVITDITVRNGSINGWGTAGVQQMLSSNLFSKSFSLNLLYEHLNISGCQVGIYANAAAIIRDCHVYYCIADGIDCNVLNNRFGSIISGCTADFNGGAGIYVNCGKVTDCTANWNQADGISNSIGTVSGCVANYNRSGGIESYSCAVSGCTAFENISNGIESDSGTVSGCSVNANFDSGIYAVNAAVSGCTARYNNDSGIYGQQSVISGCTAAGNGNNGIELDTTNTTACPGTVTDCVVQNNYDNGIFVNGGGGVITGNNCEYNNRSTNSGCAGITIYGSGSVNNRVENNHVAGTGYAGIIVNGSNNLIIKNSVFGNSANDYVITGTQIVGPIITTTGTIASANPWANFSF